MCSGPQAQAAQATAVTTAAGARATVTTLSSREVAKGPPSVDPAREADRSRARPGDAVDSESDGGAEVRGEMPRPEHREPEAR